MNFTAGVCCTLCWSMQNRCHSCLPSVQNNVTLRTNCKCLTPECIVITPECNEMALYPPTPHRLSVQPPIFSLGRWPGAAALNGYVYKIYVYKTVWWSRLYDVAKRLSSPLTVTRARTLADCYNAMLFRRCAATWHMRETIVHTWRVSIVSIALPHALELFLWSTALATAWLTGWCNSGKQPCRSLRTAMGSHSYISYTDSLVQRAVSHPHFLTWCGGHADMRQPHNPASPFLRGCDPPFR